MMRHSKLFAKLLAVLVVLAVVTAGSAFAQDSQNILRVRLDGFRSDNGKPHCTLYNDPAAFPSHDEKAVKGSDAPSIANRTAEVDFSGIAPGKYAIGVLSRRKQQREVR